MKSHQAAVPVTLKDRNTYYLTMPIESISVLSSTYPKQWDQPSNVSILPTSDFKHILKELNRLQKLELVDSDKEIREKMEALTDLECDPFDKDAVADELLALIK